MRPDVIFCAVFGAFFAYLIIASAEFSYRSSLFPILLGSTGLAVIAILLTVRLAFRRIPSGDRLSAAADEATGAVGARPRDTPESALRFIAWVALPIGASYVLGQLIALPLAVLLFLKIESRETWLFSTVTAGAIALFLYVIFEQVLKITWLVGLTGFP